MDRDTVIARLKSVENRLRSLGVARLFLYGSYSRNEARPDSDIDVLVDFAPEVDLGLRSFMAPYQCLEEQFPGIEIGYSTRDGLHPLYRPHIEPTLVQVF